MELVPKKKKMKQDSLMHFYFWHDLRGAEECGDLPAANNKIEKKKTLRRTGVWLEIQVKKQVLWPYIYSWMMPSSDLCYITFFL